LPDDEQAGATYEKLQVKFYLRFSNFKASLPLRGMAVSKPKHMVAEHASLPERLDASPLDEQGSRDAAMPASPEFDALLVLCREQNMMGRDDADVRAIASRLHWQLVWARRYHAGKKMRRTRHGIEVQGILSEPPRRGKVLADINRMHERLLDGDTAGWTKAWVESAPYVQDLVRRKLWAIYPGTPLFRRTLLFGPGDYKLIARALRELSKEPKLKGRPAQPEHDRAVRWLWKSAEWLHGRQYRGLSRGSNDGLPSGRLHAFVLAASGIYRLSLVTKKGAERLRSKNRPF
jgi:hypothetical protein